MEVLFNAFRPRAEGNQSGWGVGWYEDAKALIVKETIRADQSDKAQELIDNPPLSHTFVIHVREATVGLVSLENTHPFTGRAAGRTWIFGHNGTVKRLERLDTGKFEELGDTDSEVAFHYLLTRLDRLGDNPGDEKQAAEILAAARELSIGSKVNLLLTDGKTLYAYHDGHKSLYYLQRRPKDSPELHLKDDADYEVNLKRPGRDGEHAAIVATVPLTEEAWTKFEPGDFLVCRAGRCQLFGAGRRD